MPMSTKHHHHAQGHMQQSNQTAAQQQQHAQQAACHALCLGLGGGSLPLFLSHHFPGMFVQAVELDPVVLAAATQEMGLPAYRCVQPHAVSVDQSYLHLCVKSCLSKYL